MLRLSEVTTHYGTIRALRSVDMFLKESEIVCLLGGNASGKSTTLKAILGIVPLTEGTIEFRGVRIDGMRTSEIVKKGIGIVPEGRRIFQRMTVLENLQIGEVAGANRSGRRYTFSDIYQLFPVLKEKAALLAGRLSGGEQQMLAFGRSLMTSPDLLLMDEPSMGLAPIYVKKIFGLISRIRDLGVTVFVVEQNANMALSIADRGYVLRAGEVMLSGTSQELSQNPKMREAYLGAEGRPTVGERKYGC